MMKSRLYAGSLAGFALVFAACSGGSDDGSANAAMDLEQVSNGFGQILPHTVLEVDAQGQITPTVVSIRSNEDLLKNVNAFNPIRPVQQFPTDAILPSNLPGNHFIYATFDRDIDISTVLDPSPLAQSNSGLLGTVTLVALDPSGGSSAAIPVRAFINGFTYAGTPDPLTQQLPLQHWVELVNGVPQLAVDGQVEGVGFPGSPGYEFTGSAELVSTRSIVLVADSDDDLTTLEKFPAGKEIRLSISTGLKGTNGKNLKRPALACTTVGPDTLKPEVSTTPPPSISALVTPGQGDTDVDPLTNVRIQFTEPIQPLSLGSIQTTAAPDLSAAVFLEFGQSGATVKVPFTVTVVSVYDLTTFDLVPAFHFPGEGPSDFECGLFNKVTVTVNPNQFRDLAGSINQFGATTHFFTGEGPGVVNAPVTPDTVYLGRAGAQPGLSVVDLNGFGASTGNPLYNAIFGPQSEGLSNYPNNPNVKLQGALLRPTLTPGQCTINGGSAGVFTLTKDSSLSDLLIRTPDITSVGDMMLGHSLDSTFNNGPSPFGCQAGGGALCTLDGQKVINPVQNGAFTGNTSNTLTPVSLFNGGNNGIVGYGAENLMCWAPHPNPPPLVFPPLCVSPYIGGQEPTSIDSINLLGGGGGTGLANLLAPGDAFGQPGGFNPQPPSGLLTPEQNAFFQAPSVGQSTIAACQPYMIRQQIGHYLYVIDRGRREIVVINSNRMTVIDRIPTQDPTSLAMSPNLDLLAVVNQVGNLVSFIDIDPNSASFHTIVQETVVGNRPRGIAWEPGNEDILVCNESDNTISVISAATGTVRKVVGAQLNRPFDLAITPRQRCWGYFRDVYFAYILNRSGRVALFESGPNTVNGWGYDDVVGIVPQTFRNPKAIQPDQVDLRSAVWIAHEGQLDPETDAPGPAGTPALSKLVVESGLTGAILLNVTLALNPQFRDMAYGVQVSIGGDVLSGLPSDIAFDNLRSISGLPNLASVYSAAAPVPINGKNIMRGSCTAGGVTNNSEPRFLFAAITTPIQGDGVVDVIRVDGNFQRFDTNVFKPGTQSIPAPDVKVVMDYFRQ